MQPKTDTTLEGSGCADFVLFLRSCANVETFRMQGARLVEEASRLFTGLGTHNVRMGLKVSMLFPLHDGNLMVT